MQLSSVQRIVVVLSAVAGLVLAALILAGAPHAVVRWLETPVMAALFLAAVAARPRTRTQVLTTVALGLSALGDALLVGFLDVVEGELIGMGAFALAYLTLTAAFWRGRPRPSEAGVALALGALGVVLCVVLWPHLSALMRVVVPVFVVVIVTMAITVTGTLVRGRFPRRVAGLAAAAGLLLVASDSVVALHMFHPAFSPTPVVTEIVNRLSYLAGWLLFLLVVQEDARAVGGRGADAWA